MHYRPEIDGLRALAVLPVIAYHAGSSLFSGGYVGVDVFFVISGYLITSILVREMGEGRFSLASFYARRARRILPALFLVCAASTLAAFALMTPRHLADFSASLLATFAFASNVLFWQESGYFAPASELKPLLHTWSLAIEEQFYLLFPLLMMAVFTRSKRAAIALIAVGWVASLAIATWAMNAAPYANFFLLPSRAFELATGALIGLLPQLRPASQTLRSAGAALGLGMIALAVFSFDAETPFPGPAALLPVLGTGLVIACARTGEPVARLLSAPLLVGIGLVSYSAYLWHWPLFVFARIWQFNGGPAPNYLILTALTFALAWLSWKFVETPFRRPGSVPPARAALALLLPGAAMTALATLALATSGFDAARTSPRIAALEASAAFSPRRADCHTRGAGYLAPQDACQYTAAAPARWASFGDSHTVELSYALARALEPQGIALSHHSFSNCPPMAGRGGTSPCALWTEETLAHIAADPEIDTIIVSYRLHNYLWGDHTAHYPAQPRRFSEAHRREVWTAYLAALERLRRAGKRVVLVRQAPELPAPVSYMIARAPGPGDAIEGISRDWLEARRAYVSARLGDLPEGVILIDPAELFCDAETCRVSQGDTFFYFDENHLSLAGMDRVAAAILDAVPPR